MEEKDITELSLDFQATLSAQHTEQTIVDPGNKCFLMDQAREHAKRQLLSFSWDHYFSQVVPARMT